MNKNRLKILLILGFVIITFSFYILVIKDKNVEIEKAYLDVKKIENSYSEVGYYFFRSKHNEIICLFGDSIQILDYDFNEKRSFELATDLNKSSSFYFNDNGINMAFIEDDNDIYIVDLETEKTKWLDISNIKIIEHNGFNNSLHNLFIKFIDETDQKKYYGYIDIETSTVHKVEELNGENYYNIYDGTELRVETYYNESSLTLETSGGHLIYSFDVLSSHKWNNSFFSFFEYRLKDNLFYYIDKSHGEFGRLVRFNLNSNESEVLTDELEFEVTSIDVYDDEVFALCSTYESKSILLGSSKYPRLSELFKEKQLDYFFINNSDFSKLIYVTKDINEFVVNYHDFDSNFTKELVQIDSYVNYNKDEVRINDSHGPDLQFYLTRSNIDKKKKVAIFVHGGPFHRYMYDDVAMNQRLLLELGFDIIELNYHGSSYLGKSYQNIVGGNLPKAALEDIQLVINWVKEEYQIDSNNITLIGSSFGGYLTMLAKVHFGEEFGPAVSMIPSTIDDILRYNGEIPEYTDISLDSVEYDNWELTKDTHQKIGIIYNPFDPNMKLPKNWNVRSKQNDNITIISQQDQGHNVSFSAFKKAVYYIYDELY